MLAPCGTIGGDYDYDGDDDDDDGDKEDNNYGDED